MIARGKIARASAPRVRKKRDTLSLAVEHVVRNRDAGVVCPCCGQLVRVYRRTINDAMARWLCWLVREFETQGNAGFVDARKAPIIQNRVGGGDYGKLAYWGLCKLKANTDDSSRRTTALWRPTSKGVAFAYGSVRVPKWALVYDGKLLDFDNSSTVSIRDVLGKRFDYAELMRA